MNRINVYAESTGYDDRPVLEGWFDLDKAAEFREDTTWDGSNHISVPTGSQWDHEYLYRTAQGRWVLNRWSQRQGTQEAYRFIPDQQARDWLLANSHDGEVAKYFGEIEDERGPGRPKVGEQVCFTADPADLAAADRIAQGEGITRSALLRRILRDYIADKE